MLTSLAFMANSVVMNQLQRSREEGVKTFTPPFLFSIISYDPGGPMVVMFLMYHLYLRSLYKLAKSAKSFMDFSFEVMFTLNQKSFKYSIYS